MFYKLYYLQTQIFALKRSSIVPHLWIRVIVFATGNILKMFSDYYTHSNIYGTVTNIYISTLYDVIRNEGVGNNNTLIIITVSSPH